MRDPRYDGRFGSSDPPPCAESTVRIHSPEFDRRCAPNPSDPGRYRSAKRKHNSIIRNGVLAVEMKAASLFAFGVAKQDSLASVATVSNTVDHAGAQFDTPFNTFCIALLPPHVFANSSCGGLSESKRLANPDLLSARIPQMRFEVNGAFNK